MKQIAQNYKSGELTVLDVPAPACRPGELRNLIADEQAGREDRAKQIWQLLSMELWYDHAHALGVRA